MDSPKKNIDRQLQRSSEAAIDRSIYGYTILDTDKISQSHINNPCGLNSRFNDAQQSPDSSGAQLQCSSFREPTPGFFYGRNMISSPTNPATNVYTRMAYTSISPSARRFDTLWQKKPSKCIGVQRDSSTIVESHFLTGPNPQSLTIGKLRPEENRNRVKGIRRK